MSIRIYLSDPLTLLLIVSVITHARRCQEDKVVT